MLELSIVVKHEAYVVLLAVKIEDKKTFRIYDHIEGCVCGAWIVDVRYLTLTLQRLLMQLAEVLGKMLGNL